VKNLEYYIATEKDIPFISQTYHENISALHGIYRSEDVWKELLSIKDSTYYIVRADTSVAWFRIDIEADELWVGMLQVKPCYHRKGIGKYILSVVEGIAKEKGYKSVGVHTTEDNAVARTFYLSVGYSVTEIGPCTTADGKERVGYTFQKHIL